jgi:hypothetical protein
MAFFVALCGKDGDAYKDVELNSRFKKIFDGDPNL